MSTISWDDFAKIDIRAGTIMEVNDFPKAKNPAYQISIDFGDLGIKRSSAQITGLYDKNKPKWLRNLFFNLCLKATLTYL